jgi:hypothetical protein
MTGETRFHIAALGYAFAGDLPSWMVKLTLSGQIASDW